MMKHFMLISLAALVTATPFTLFSKRSLAPSSRLQSRDASPSPSPSPSPSCPGDLTPGQYEIPHYITQISKSNPDRSYGPQYSAVFTPDDVASIFAFDIPASRHDANCTLEFLFPRKDQLRTSDFVYDGTGTFFVKQYKVGSCPGAGTTWNHQPAMGESPDNSTPEMIVMQPGNAYTISMGSCGEMAGNCFAAIIATNDTNFDFFQDRDQCPIGLYTSYV